MKCIRFFFITWIISVLAIAGYSQSIDERIGNYMNNGKWPELRRLYFEEGDKLQSPMLHLMSRFLIYHFYNQPDSALHYGVELLNKHQAELGQSVGPTVYFMADNFARVGDFKNATQILHMYNDAARQAGAVPDSIMVHYEKQYQVLADCGGFQTIRPNHDISVPLRFFSDKFLDPVMLYIPIKINDISFDATYDTGAGINMISRELAEQIKARVFNTQGLKIRGATNEDISSCFAIIDSIQLGDIVYRNVPFQVMETHLTDHSEADKKIKGLNMQCILGNQTMLPLREIQFDFAHKCLRIPAQTSTMPDFAPNIYRSVSKMLMLSLKDQKSGKTIVANLDTGSAITMLTTKYYNENKEMFASQQPNDSVRLVGVGGVSIMDAYSIPWSYIVGYTETTQDKVSVLVGDSQISEEYDCLLGLPSLVQHDLLTINFKDMWVKLSSINK